MRARASMLTIVAASMVAACGSKHAAAPPPAQPAKVVTHVSHDTTVARLELALRDNPNNQATSAVCRRATPTDRRIAIASFGGHPRRLFACVMTIGGLPPATYDVSLMGRCFVGHRRGANIADYGCLS